MTSHWRTYTKSGAPAGGAPVGRHRIVAQLRLFSAQTWLWLPPGAGGGLGALTETARDVPLPRAEVTAIWQHPGVVRDGRAPR